MKNHTNKSCSFLPWRYRLGQKISQIQVSIHIDSTPFVTSSTFAEKMIGNNLGFIFQIWIRYSSAGKNTLIVTKDEGGRGEKNLHDAMLVS